MAGTGLPRFIERGGEAVLRPPYKADDVDFFGFAIRASRPALDSMFDRYVNEPSGGKFDYRAATDIVLVVFTRTNKLSSTDPLDAKAGETEEMEASLWVLGVDPESDDVGFFVPYILNDNPIAVATGREVYGYPKRLAAVTMPKLGPEWTGIVSTPTGEQLRQSAVNTAIGELQCQLGKLAGVQTAAAMAALARTAVAATSEDAKDATTVRAQAEKADEAATSDRAEASERFAAAEKEAKAAKQAFDDATEAEKLAQGNAAAAKEALAAARSAQEGAPEANEDVDSRVQADPDALLASLSEAVEQTKGWHDEAVDSYSKLKRRATALEQKAIKAAAALREAELEAEPLIAAHSAARAEAAEAQRLAEELEEVENRSWKVRKAEKLLRKAQVRAGVHGVRRFPVDGAGIGAGGHRHLAACKWEEGELGFLFKDSFSNHENDQHRVLMSAFPVYDKTCDDATCDGRSMAEWSHHPLISVVAQQENYVDGGPKSEPCTDPEDAELVALAADGKIANSDDQFAWTRGSSALAEVLQGILQTDGPIFVAEKTGQFARGRAVELRGFSFSREERSALSRLAEGIVENYDRTTVAFNLRGLIDDGGVRLVFLKQIRDAHERGAAALQQVIPATLRFSGDQYTRGFKIAEKRATPVKPGEKQSTGLMVRLRNSPELFPIIRELGLRTENEVLFAFYLRFGFSIELATTKAT